MTRRPFALDLFAGCGGASLGLLAAGYAVHGVELDPDAAGWHANNVGPCYRADVADIGRQIGGIRVDLLWASPPCQPYSRAGKRQGAADARDGFPITRDAIQTFFPNHVIVENVRGSEAQMDDLAAWMRSRGWPTAQVVTVDAADFGVPQHRRRVILTTGPVPNATHTSPKALGLVPRAPRAGEGLRTMYDAVALPAMVTQYDAMPRLPWETVRNALPALAAEARTRPPMVGTGQNTHLRGARVPHLTPIDEPAPTLRARGDRGGSPMTVEPRPEWWHRGIDDTDAPSRTIGSKGNTTIALSTAGSEPDRLDAPSCAVTTTEEKGTRASPSSGGRFNGGPDRAADVAYLAVGRRRLTVEECAALQGFPAGLPWGDFRTKTLAYRGVGNAVPPKLASVFARAIDR
jgi:site-specific DNA-cytosine methylase